MRRGPKPAKSKEAKPPVARKSPKDDGTGLGDVEKRLAEALRDKAEVLEQQAATAEILRLISSSPTDIQPVFDAIAVNAFRLCDAEGVVVTRYDGTLLRVAAVHNVKREAVDRMERQYPRAPSRDLPSGRAVLDGVVVHVPDLQAAVEFASSVPRQLGAGSHISIPLLHQGRAIGVIGISRWKRGPFPDRHIELLKTFAAQAVIAIENVRLFKELEASNRDLTESLTQQAGTADVLKVISSSPTDLQRALNTLTEAAAQLCDADHAAVYRLEGDWMSAAAFYGPVQSFGQPLGRGSVVGRAMVDRRTIHVHDLAAEPDAEYPEGKAAQRRLGHRTVVATPLLREGHPIGALALWCMEVRPFSDKQVALLQTFADQAVIAIENVRLFKELEARNRDLTTALDQQTATAEILRVISGSPTDVQPVFDAIVTSAMRLLGGFSATLRQLAGDQLDLVAFSTTSEPGDEALKSLSQLPLADDPFSPRRFVGGRRVLRAILRPMHGWGPGDGKSHAPAAIACLDLG
jgi:GAF domain-containing protein